MAKDLRILAWNANGLLGKTTELRALVEDLNIDIILISETHLKATQTVNIANFFCYRTDRQTNNHCAGGGTAVYVNRKITHQQKIIHTNLIEQTAIHFNFNNEEFRIVSVYNKPTQIISTNDIDELFNTPTPTIIMGDLNSKHPAWNSRTSNRNGKLLQQHALLRDYTVLGPDIPTYVHCSGLYRPDVLDIALLKRVTAAYSIETIEDLSSDHSPVLFCLEGACPAREPPAQHNKAINWKKFYETLQRTHTTPPTLLESNNDIDHCTELLTSDIQYSLTNSKQTRRQEWSRNALPPHILNSIDLKRQLRRLYRLTLDPAVKRQLNIQTKIVKDQLITHREDTWNEYLHTISSADNNNDSIFQLIKKLKRTKTPTQPLHGQRGMAYSEEDKCEAFADTLRDQFSPNDDLCDDDHEDEVDGYLHDYFNETDETDNVTVLNANNTTDAVTEAEVKVAITSSHPDKAPGLDNITGRALRHAPPSVIQTLCILFTSIISTCYFPTTWKKAKIVCFPKPGKDLLFPQNYRPISLLPTISKIFEKILLVKIKKYLDPLLRPEQYGFREEHSTTLQLLRLIDSIATGFNRKLVTATALLDIAKAFDKVWHHGLLYKLAKSSLPKRYVRLLRSYLQKRCFVVAVQNHLSSEREIAAGVPQGAVLSAYLYIFYTNDLPSHPGVDVSLYADDTAFFYRSTNTKFAIRILQRQLDAVVPWLEKWKIKLNSDKTTTIIFRPNPSTKNLPNITLLNNTIQFQKTARYLGVILDNRLTFNKHIDYITQKARAARAILYPVLNKRSPIPLTTKLLLYKVYVLPILTYAFPAWGALASPRSKKKMEAVQNIALRTIFGAPWYVRNVTLLTDANMTPVVEYGKDLTTNLFTKTALSKHEHIRDLLRNDPQPQVIRNRPHSLIQ